MPRQTKTKVQELPEVVKQWISEGKPRSMDHSLSPMSATLGDKPFDSADWVYEIKYDGYRSLAFIEDGKVNLRSRKNIKFKHFDDVCKELEKVRYNCILDGEITVLNDDGLPDFQLIQSWQLSAKGFLVFYVFDILYLEGVDLTQLPLIKRKQILENILPKSKIILYCDHIEGSGKALFDHIAESNLEGIIAKKKNSKYYAGHRSDSWLKIKNKKVIDAVICGFTQSRGNSPFGSLILGEYIDGQLHYIGRNSATLAHQVMYLFKKLLEPDITDKCPFADVPKTDMPPTWLKPRMVVELTYTDRTSDGYLRHAVLNGVRDDKTVDELKKESLL